MRYIYIIKCIPNNKVYIGQTNNFNRRVSEHLYDLNKGNHHNVYIQHDFNLYGVSNFQFEIISVVSDDNANKAEDAAMALYGGIDSDNIYNMQNNVTHNYIMNTHISSGLKGKLVGHKNPMYGNHTNNLGNRMNTQIRFAISKTKSRSSHNYLNSESVGNHLKYTQSFIDLLRKDKQLGLTYSDLEKKYNINHSTLCNLINYGTCNPKRNKV